MADARPTREGPGLLATLGGAVLLVVLGFGIGLVAGAAYEEPELVMEHLTGDTRDVPLIVGRDAELEPTPQVGAAPPPLGAAPPAPRRRAGPAPAAPVAKGGFAVQVGAFGTAKSARGLVDQLEEAGFPSYVAKEEGGHAPFKVRVGPIPTQDEAAALASRLKTEHRLPTWVLSRGSGAGGND